MSTLQVLALQVPWNLLVYALIARFYVAPRLARLPIFEALQPMVLIHLVRPISLWTTTSGVIPGMAIPSAWAWSTAIGDLLAAGLALASLLLLRRRAPLAIATTWVFNVVGFVDAVKNGVQAVRMHIAPGVGIGGLLMAYAVPVLFVSHGVIFWLLVRHARGAHPDAA